MKTFWLVLHNIKKIYKKHLFVFLLIVISMSVSSFGMLFYSGYIGEICVERELGNGDCVKLTLLENTQDEDLNNMLNMLVTNYEQLCRIKLCNTQRNETNNSSIESMEDYNEKDILIVGEYNKQYSNRLLVGRNLEYKENGAVAVIPSDYVSYLEYDDVPVNISYDTKNESVEIVGVLSYMDEEAITVPIKYYIENYNGKYLDIGFEKRLTTEERRQIDDILMEANIVENYNWILSKSALQSFDFWIEFLQVLLIFFVIIINIFVIVYFLMLRMKHTYSIYAVCGGGDKRILCVITIQAFLIILLGILVGFIGFLIFLLLTREINLVYQNSLFFYVKIVGLISSISLLLSVTTCRKINHNITVYRTSE